MKDKLQLFEEQVDNLVDIALAEDISHGDITSEILIPSELQGRSSILVKAKGILAGGEVARKVFLKVDPSLKVIGMVIYLRLRLDATPE